METSFLNILQRSKDTEKLSAKNTARVIKSGAAFFWQLKQLIEQAEHSINLQIYLLSKDATGNEIANSLMASAKRGVTVYLMADGYASRMLPKNVIQKLENAGVHFRFFEPFFRGTNFYFGRRLHHKVAVFDTRYALVSGSNI